MSTTLETMLTNPPANPAANPPANPAANTPAPHYLRPDWFTRNVANRVLRGLTGLGLSVRGSRILEHRGRKTGALHRTPVNLLLLDGTEYLVAPRGETQWVRNVRHSGGRCVLILGRRRRQCTAREVPLDERVPVLRAYLRKWGFETKLFFDGVSADSSDAEWEVAAARHPVFALA